MRAFVWFLLGLLVSVVGIAWTVAFALLAITVVVGGDKSNDVLRMLPWAVGGWLLLQAIGYAVQRFPKAPRAYSVGWSFSAAGALVWMALGFWIWQVYR